MVVLVKTFNHYRITSFNFFSCPVKLWRDLKLKITPKFNHDFTNDGYLHGAIWKTLYNFKIKRAQKARHNQFFFQNVQEMRSLRSSKCLKTTAELTFTTPKANACSSSTACSDFNLKYHFWVNLGQKLRIISLNWNFVPRQIQICRIPWWCSLTENTFLGEFSPKYQNCQFELKFRIRLIWICRIM